MSISHNITCMVDVRKPLVDTKKSYPVYYKTGTHWNPFGAYVACNGLLEALSSRSSGQASFMTKSYTFVEFYKKHCQ